MEVLGTLGWKSHSELGKLFGGNLEDKKIERNTDNRALAVEFQREAETSQGLQCEESVVSGQLEQKIINCDYQETRTTQVNLCFSETMSQEIGDD